MKTFIFIFFFFIHILSTQAIYDYKSSKAGFQVRIIKELVKKAKDDFLSHVPMILAYDAEFPS